MNNQLIARQNGRMANQSDTSALIATLPKWLQYLIGAFPAAQTNTMTYLAYETAFAEVDAALMLTAVQAVTKQHKFSTFPTIAEIGQTVTVLTQRAELEDALTNRPRVNLATARHRLIEAAYRGEIDPADWSQLYRLCISHKRLAVAFALKRQYERFTGEALAS